MFKKKLLPIIFIFLSSSLFADGQFNGFFPHYTSCQFDWCNSEFSLYGGGVDIKSQELVFDKDEFDMPQTISKLDWHAQNIWVVGAKAKVNACEERLFFALDGWSQVSGNKAHMEDRDFLDPEDPYHETHLSIHSDTKLKSAVSLDLECGYNFYTASTECSRWNFGYLLGIKYQRYHWDAYGGYFDYIIEGKRYLGSLSSDTLAIGYTQNFTVPYIGLQVDWNWNSCLDLTVFAKYSCLAYISCRDNHALRSIIFTDRHRNGQYWELGTDAALRLSDRFQLIAKYAYNKLNRTTGNTTVDSKKETYTIHGSAGIAHCYHLIAIGLITRF